MNISAGVATYVLGLVLWLMATAANAETAQSFTNVPVAVICPSPTFTAYLESAEAPPHFSKEWEYKGGHAHCRTVKSDRPLLVTRVVSVAFHGREYTVAEAFPGGVIVSVDGFGGPYYILTSRIKKLPTIEQMHANAAAFLPTIVQYNVNPSGSSAPAASPPPASTATAGEPEAASKPSLDGAAGL
jgi:hypothetical protein